MQIITKRETKTYRSRVGESTVINYRAESEGGQPSDTVHGDILKDDLVVGYFNANRNGESGLTFLRGAWLSADEKQAVSRQIYEDESAFFNEA